MLRDNLFPASFRGVAFDVTTSDLTIGRRTQTFEYPQRDRPFVEDLGRAARLIQVEAIIVGPDFVARMNRLIDAMETAGSGTLVHPFLGTMSVTPQSTTQVSYDTAGLGQASATLSFVESGDYEFPNSVSDTTGKLLSAADAAGIVSEETFGDAFDLSTLQDFGVGLVTDSIDRMLSVPALQSVANGIGLAVEFGDLVKDAANLAQHPAALFSAVSAVFGMREIVGTALGWTNAVRGICSALRSPDLRQDGVASTGLIDHADIDEAALQAQAMIRRELLIGAARGSSNVGGALDVLPGASQSTMAYDDIIGVRDGLLAAFDAEMEDSITSDEDYRALAGLRSLVWEDLTTRAERHAHLVEFTPSEVKPALVIAYEYYGDASRDSEIAERNGIRHAGFCPAIPLKLLSE